MFRIYVLYVKVYLLCESANYKYSNLVFSVFNSTSLLCLLGCGHCVFAFNSFSFNPQ